MRIAEADSRARGWQGMGLGQQSFSTLMSSNVTASCSLVKPVSFFFSCLLFLPLFLFNILHCHLLPRSTIELHLWC